MPEFERSLIVIYLAGLFAALALLSLPMVGPFAILVALLLLGFCVLFLTRMSARFGNKATWAAPSLLLAVSPAVYFWLYLQNYYSR